MIPSRKINPRFLNIDTRFFSILLPIPIRCDEIENFSCRLPPVARHAIPFTFFHPPVSNATFRYYIRASTFVKNAVLLRRRKKKMDREIPRLVKSRPRIPHPHPSPCTNTSYSIYSRSSQQLNHPLPPLFLNWIELISFFMKIISSQLISPPRSLYRLHCPRFLNDKHILLPPLDL